jgi:hypothetical protein
VCGDPEALVFAEAMTEGFFADLQPGHLRKRDGHIAGHSHTQMHAIRGVAQLGALTQNWRYLDWAKTAYDFAYITGFDTGWIPELQGSPDHRDHSETCLVADMLEIAVWLARAGQPQFWDRVDRTVRNYLVPAQFSLTPEFLTFWREINSDKSVVELECGLAGLRELEGGFLSSIAANDRVIQAHPGQSHPGLMDFRGQHISVEMAGCCPPSGMRAIHLAWTNTVLRTGLGVMVNLAFDRDAPEAEVTTEMPRRGRLRVTAKMASDFFLRPPSWAPRDQVKAWRDGRELELLWGGPAHDYLRFPAAQAGETLEVTWPLVRFVQRVAQRYEEAISLKPTIGRYDDETGSIRVGAHPQHRGGRRRIGSGLCEIRPDAPSQ